MPNPTTLQTANAIATHLSNHKNTWTQLEIPKRISYLQRCIDGVLAVAQPWVEAACQAKGNNPTVAGEEWLSGPFATIRNLQLLIKALKAQGQPQPISWHTRPDGQMVAQVFPGDLTDRLLWMGFTAEVWIEPGQPPTQGAAYREPTAGGVALVLGAGNVSSIAPMDTLYKLFVHSQVVILKMNPVNEYIGPFLEQAFQSLSEDGFFGVVYGGADLGSYLTHHPAIDTIHITGSHHTHDAIVWGSTPEQVRRKAANEPLLSKPITSELGCVTPVLVVPGPWSQGDIAFQTQHVASMVAHNASFNCNAAKVVVTASGWKQQEAFLTHLHTCLAAIPQRQAYYPGAQQRYQSFLYHYPRYQALGPRTEQSVPWTVISNVSPAPEEYALTHEAFCGVLAEVSLNAVHARDFLPQAVDFVNQKVWGTLSCVLLVHPATATACKSELDQAIANLRYGGIGVNTWTGVNYSLGVTTWGAFPGHPLTDITSGRGVVHNAYLFDHPQKSVVRAPFRIAPTPAWFATHKNLQQLGQQLTAYEASSSWDKFLGVMLAAMQG